MALNSEKGERLASAAQEAGLTPAQTQLMMLNSSDMSWFESAANSLGLNVGSPELQQEADLARLAVIQEAGGAENGMKAVEIVEAFGRRQMEMADGNPEISAVGSMFTDKGALTGVPALAQFNAVNQLDKGFNGREEP